MLPILEYRDGRYAHNANFVNFGQKTHIPTRQSFALALLWRIKVLVYKYELRLKNLLKNKTDKNVGTI